MSWFTSNKPKGKSIQQLAYDIFEKSINSTKSLDVILKEVYGTDAEGFPYKFIELVHKFLFLYLHLTDRLALHVLGEPKRGKIMDELVETTVDLTINSFFNNLSDEEKRTMKIQTYQYEVNRAMELYGNATELVDVKKPFTSNAVFTHFSKEVGQFLKKETNPEVRMIIVEVGVKGFSELDIKTKLEKIR